MSVKAKKHLGQHFLTDENVAQKIADSLTNSKNDIVLEIGPGMGVLTKYLLAKQTTTYVAEIDNESVSYLEKHFPSLDNKIIAQDFLKLNLKTLFEEKPFAVIGNFPYNISSQIVFKCIEYRAYIPEFAGMFQKEVAQRICASSGSKTYGILSVITQAFYDTEYLFTVPPEVFNPPPKVDSGVMRMVRKDLFELEVDEKLFFKVVKQAFNQRRKTLRNSLKSFDFPENFKEDSIFTMRPEQIEVADFILITQKIETHANRNK